MKMSPKIVPAALIAGETKWNGTLYNNVKGKGNSMRLPNKLNTELPYDSATVLLNTPPRGESKSLKRDWSTHVHSSIRHKSQRHKQLNPFSAGIYNVPLNVCVCVCVQ